MSTPVKNIVIVGGGAAATTLASTLEASIKKYPGYNIVLITGRDYFFHLIAGLRANVTSAELAENICVPYDRLFKNQAVSRVVQKKATTIKDGKVVLEDGEEIPYAYLVVATGKQWVSPIDIPDKRADAIEMMKTYRDRVAKAKNIVVVGGGAVGIEVAGEIAASYPQASGKKVTLVHSRDKLMNDVYPAKFRDGLAKQLLDLGVNLHFGDSIEGEHDFETTGHTTIKTKKGESLPEVDLIIQATGGRVNSQILEGFLPASEISSGGVKVRPTFQVNGHDNVFVIGDLADLPEQKQAAKVPGHVSIASLNILASINKTALSNYKAPGEMIVVNIADKGGMGMLTMPVVGQVTMGAWFSKTVKGKDLFVSKTRTAMGY